MKSLLLLSMIAAAARLPAGETEIAAAATNQLGIELLSATGKQSDNHLISPYSIQSALAMTFAGADGETRAEMAKVLHFPKDDAPLQTSFSALNKALETAVTQSAARAKIAEKYKSKKDVLQLRIANRLFGQDGYQFRKTFLSAMETGYGAPMEELDFAHASEKAREHINQWVERQTEKRIRDLIPPRGVDKDTRLVLTNALYLKVPWENKFEKGSTTPQPFHVRGGPTEKVATMLQQRSYPYARHEGFAALAVPYDGRELQFLILLPDSPTGLAALEKNVSPDLLRSCATMKSRPLILHLPKIKLEPPTLPLAQALQSLGMHTAFDKPAGSANFDRMAPRKPDDYLAISAVFHKTFLALDEEGTEAAAATAVVMMMLGSAPPRQEPPIEVKVDRPFLFAIQHCASGACLFLGHVVDPRR